MLVDLRPKGVTGKMAEEGLEKAGITCNKKHISNFKNVSNNEV